MDKLGSIKRFQFVTFSNRVSILIFGSTSLVERETLSTTVTLAHASFIIIVNKKGYGILKRLVSSDAIQDAVSIISLIS